MIKRIAIFAFCFCLCLTALPVFGDAVQLGAYNVYTFWSPNDLTSFTAFTNTITTPVTSAYNSIFIKLNVVLDEITNKGDYLNTTISLNMMNCAGLYPLSYELLDKNYNALSSGDEFGLSNAKIQLNNIECPGSVKTISFVFQVANPRYTLSGDNYIWTLEPTNVEVEYNRDENFFERMVRSLSELPQKILDGLKALVVPSEADIIVIKDKWLALCEQRFGAVYQAAAVISDFASSLKAEAAVGSIEFPLYEFDLGVTKWKFGGWNVQLVPDGFDKIIDVLKVITNIACTFAFVNGLRKRLEGILGGEHE